MSAMLSGWSTPFLPLSAAKAFVTSGIASEYRRASTYALAKFAHCDAQRRFVLARLRRARQAFFP